MACSGFNRVQCCCDTADGQPLLSTASCHPWQPAQSILMADYGMQQMADYGMQQMADYGMQQL
jgi:hypothetical protein